MGTNSGGLAQTYAMPTHDRQYHHPTAPSGPWPSNVDSASVPTQPVPTYCGSRVNVGTGQAVPMANSTPQQSVPISDAFAGDLGLGTDDDDSMDDDALFAALEAVEHAQTGRQGQAALHEPCKDDALPTQRYSAPQVLGQDYMCAPGGARPAPQPQQFAAPSFAGPCHASSICGLSLTQIHVC